VPLARDPLGKIATPILSISCLWLRHRLHLWLMFRWGRGRGYGEPAAGIRLYSRRLQWARGGLCCGLVQCEWVCHHGLRPACLFRASSLVSNRRGIGLKILTQRMTLNSDFPLFSRFSETACLSISTTQQAMHTLATIYLLPWTSNFVLVHIELISRYVDHACCEYAADALSHTLYLYVLMKYSGSLIILSQTILNLTMFAETN
jgi:hypothetical protein